MEQLREHRYTGERALFNSRDLDISDCIFADGESPLKESSGIRVEHTTFQWKYPFWYCDHIHAEDCMFAEMARAGIWYGRDIALKNCLYEAPKGLRRIDGLSVEGVNFLHADETLWHCSDVTLSGVSAKGNYFGMNCRKVRVDGLQLAGDYCFDGCTDVEVHHAKLLSKDAFWNCENVTVTDSYITGEYLGWNSTNIKFVNCTIESLQGMCYMKNLVMENCRLINTTLAFEYSDVDAEITTTIDSVKNPSSGTIRAKGIGELILDETKVDPAQTNILIV